MLEPSTQKLTPEQLEEAFLLLHADIPLREVAGQFGISHEALRRLAQRDGIEVRPRGQKLSATLRGLTPEQRQEAVDLINAGVSKRQVARQFGINRYSFRHLVDGDGSFT